MGNIEKKEKTRKASSGMEGGTPGKVQRLSRFLRMEFVLVLVLYGVMSIGIHWQINAVQPGPYMDEIFHIPQCQKYCRGLYSEVRRAMKLLGDVIIDSFNVKACGVFICS